MKRILPIVLVFIFLHAKAQSYLISFSANGAATTIDSVKVQNLDQGTSMTISGSDTLQLLGTVGVKRSLKQGDKLLQVYPNPSEQTSLIEFDNQVSGPVTVDIYNTAGKRILHSDYNLNQGLLQFQISNLPFGLNLVVLRSANYTLTGKLVSQYIGNEKAVIGLTNGNSLQVSRINATTNYVSMPYNQGDRLLTKAYSGIYSAVRTTVPTASGVLSYTFFACTDFDYNHYSTVQIGTQVWMAENLKVSKYRNGDTILTGLSNSEWETATTGAYAIYNNDSANNLTHGKLYNWYAVAELRGLCPTGWHVPSAAEWTSLENFLGGPSVAGGKMKAVSSLWNSPNTGATNESGFSGLPGGHRNLNGNYNHIGNYGNWWSSTELSPEVAEGRVLLHDYGWSQWDSGYVRHGFSVRCLKD